MFLSRAIDQGDVVDFLPQLGRVNVGRQGRSTRKAENQGRHTEERDRTHTLLHES